MTNYPPPTSIDRTNTPSQQRSAISSLYVLKALCAFIVVMIHSHPIGEVIDRSLMSPFVFVAVPIFYMITGYFLFSDTAQKVADKALQSAKKVLTALILLNIAYLIPLLLNGKMPLNSLKEVVEFLRYGMSIEGVLWYMTGLLYSLIVIYLVCRFGGYRYLIWGVLLVPIGILLTRYAFVFGASKALFSEFIFYGVALPYILLGFCIKRYESKLLRYNYEVLTYVLLALSVLEVYALDTYLPGYWGRFITTPLLAASAMLWCLQNPMFGRGSFIARVGQDYSGNIYYWHKMVLFTMRGLVTHTGINIFYEEIELVYVFTIGLLVAMLSVYIQKKLHLNLLK